MLSALKFSQTSQAKKLLASSPSPFGIRLRQAMQSANPKQPQSSTETMTRDPTDTVDSGDTFMTVDVEYVTRCEDEGYGGIIYGKGKHFAIEDEEPKTAAQDIPTKSTGQPTGGGVARESTKT
ncbi:OLC1v1010842C1 [Oldenlandia corymbosa var. corymbosa]|uniref:OLC1v1010842C1 n=1 Tax=Oldenlandia corymbosa var. corymbosa TaxID=529605 RepID=A0AAV1DSW6_OLDCO|nr:OLC1v1010842C1 [Oldenlandia corymbosa var. corymbosa]